MGKLMQEFFEKEKALRLAKQIEKELMDLKEELGIKANTREVIEQYKKAHCSTDQSKNNELSKTFNDIIPPGTDIDNGQVYEKLTGNTIRDL